jgi:hydrogenase maturation protease
MSAELDAVARALLLEGHLLYPYDARALKNRHRWLFGRLYPEAWVRRSGGAEASSMVTECLVRGGDGAVVRGCVRFLQVVDEAAVAREVDVGAHAIGAACASAAVTRFAFPPGVEAVVEVEAARVPEGCLRLRVVVRNEVRSADLPDEDHALQASLLATHVALALDRGSFVSLRDPPPELAEEARACRSRGAWPILFGPDELLCSPIFLDDHPRVSPESPAELFDAVELDELLTLHILALSDDERQIMAEDPWAREALARTLALGPEARMRLRGRVVRRGLIQGARVILRPRGRADVLDLALAGRAATVCSVDEDLDGRVHVGVTVDDDPGRDMGERGHRFFFDPSEVEIVGP